MVIHYLLQKLEIPAATEEECFQASPPYECRTCKSSIEINAEHANIAILTHRRSNEKAMNDNNVIPCCEMANGILMSCYCYQT